MPSSSPDLNSNLMKSLSSAYLPPPPSQTTVISGQGKLAPSVSFEQQDLANTDSFITKHKRSKRRSSTTEELMLPLKTPPHSVTRSNNESSISARKRNQITPTLTQARSKPNQNPISPQYSSPNTSLSDIQVMKPSTKKQNKPPQPTFTTRSKLPYPKSSPIAEPLSSDPVEPPRPKTPEQSKEDEDEFELPSPGSMHEIVHEGNSKPPYSYATLIGMAILRGEDRKLTLSQIYSWISNTFKFYRKDDLGWQNSIRHNLSLNKAFIKTDKSSDGKGHYWEVVEGHELQFVRGKAGKKTENVKPTKKKSQKKLVTSDEDSGESEFDNESNTNKNDSIYNEKVLSSTPKKQIRATLFDQKPIIKKSNSVIGIQRFPHVESEEEESDYDDDEEYEDYVATTDTGAEKKQKKEVELLNKRQQLRSISVNNGALPHTTTFLAQPLGSHWINHTQSSFEHTQADDISNSKISFTSSFSSVTNFEMSPIRRKDSGPLLEPLTPSSRLTSFNQQQFSSHIKTPLRNSTNSTNGLSAMSSTQTNKLHNFLKTPVAKTRTPNTNSIMKKFWNSPAFIDDFYTSPSVQRSSIDRADMISKRLFGSPEAKRILQLQFDQTNPSKSHQFYEHTTNFPVGYSDLFGVDIHSVVQRAVEKEKKTQQSFKKAVQEDESVSTDDDLDNN